jgi:hypothetical protein
MWAKLLARVLIYAVAKDGARNVGVLYFHRTLAVWAPNPIHTIGHELRCIFQSPYFYNRDTK